MAANIPPGYGEAAFILSGNSLAPFVTTLGVNVQGLTLDEYQDAANALFDAYDEFIMPFTASGLQLDRVDLRIGLAGGTSGTVSSSAIPTQGDRSSVSYLFAAAPVVQKKSADLGRRGRGRSFLPGVLAEDDVLNDGDLKIGIRTALNTAYNDMLTALATFPVGDALAPVILHADESTPTPITGVTVAQKVGLIRSRLV